MLIHILGFARYICKENLINAVFLALLFLVPGTSFGQDPGPREFIEDLYKEIKAINSMRIAPDAQMQKIKAFIINNVDFNLVAKLVLGKNVISQKDFEEFKFAYQNYMSSKYSKLLLGYKQNLQILNVENTGKNRFLVNTSAKLADSQNGMKISYLVVSINNQYRIVDVILADGVSLVITDRNEFQSFLEIKAIKDLILKLNKASSTTVSS